MTNRNKYNRPIIVASATLGFNAGLSITAKAEQGVAVIRIADVIDESGTASAIKINQQVDKFISEGLNTATIYINSIGGSTFSATEIANELARFPVKPKIKVGAVAASAATYLCAKFHTTAKRNSRFMIHKPMMKNQGNEDAIESNLKVLKNITSEYRTAYATKTGKSDEEIEALWSRGDVWMTAQEAKEFGLVDEIEDSDEAIDKKTVAHFTACGCPTSHIPVINVKSMNRDELISMLGLPADATDEQIKEALQAMKDKASKADDTAESEEAKAEKKAKDLVAKAITEKRITADKKDMYETLAKADYTTTKAVLEDMPVASQLSKEATERQRGIVDARKDWDVDKWLDEDPDGFKALEKTDPERFTALNKTYFKS